MAQDSKKKIIRLLGVGFDHEDGHMRITNGEDYDVVMGSEESHAYLQQFIQLIEDTIKEQGKTLDEITPEELRKIISDLQS